MPFFLPRDCRLPTSLGIGPASKLESARNCLRFDNNPTWDGNDPTNLFSLRKIDSRKKDEKGNFAEMGSGSDTYQDDAFDQWMSV